jgi:hypothetical protein
MGFLDPPASGRDVGLLVLGRKRIRGAGREHQVVGLEHFTRRKRHPASVDARSATADEATFGEQPLVREEDAVEPLGLDEGLEAECLGDEDDGDAGGGFVVDDQCLCEHCSGEAGVLHAGELAGEAVLA